ncbi:MAG: hypothetical protein WBQ32_09245, partial [Ignavibacteriaceae bacterium]
MQDPSKKIIKIIIVEDNSYLRTAWKTELEKIPDFLILGDYNSCEAAFESSDLEKSDIILMD